jgi:uncharacterized protein
MDAGRLFGRGISFPPRVGVDGRIVWSQGEANIREAIYVILMTQFRERINQPDFGGNLGLYLFEPNTVSTRQLIQTQIEKALSRWEPRIQLDSVFVDADPTDPQAAVATILYRLVVTGAREQASFSITLGS